MNINYEPHNSVNHKAATKPAGKELGKRNINTFIAATLVPILLFAASVLAQEVALPASSSRVHLGFLSCACSPTNRGAAAGVISELRTAQTSLHQLTSADVKRGFSVGDLLNKYSPSALNLFQSLVAKYGQEAVTNADFALRSNGRDVMLWREVYTYPDKYAAAVSSQMPSI